MRPLWPCIVNSTYLSPVIQNEIISRCEAAIREMAAETQNCSEVEQLSVFVWNVYNDAEVCKDCHDIFGPSYFIPPGPSISEKYGVLVQIFQKYLDLQIKLV